MINSLKNKIQDNENLFLLNFMNLLNQFVFDMFAFPCLFSKDLSRILKKCQQDIHKKVSKGVLLLSRFR